MYIFKLAWHYATCRRVNLVACLTIALCVMVQVVVMAVLDGMLDQVKQRIIGLGEQITFDMPYYEDATEQTFNRFAEAARQVPGVKGVTPVMQSWAAVTYHNWQHPVRVRGIDLKAEAKYGELQEFLLDLREPSWNYPGAKVGMEELPGIIIGNDVANSLGISSGDIRNGVELIVEFFRPGEDKLIRRHFLLASRFQTGIDLIDRYYIYIPLTEAQEIFGEKGSREISFGAVWLDDPSQTMKLKPFVKQKLIAVAHELKSDPPIVLSAEDRWGRIFVGMTYENQLQEVVMGFISLANGFAIFAIMYTLVAARIRDIGILRSVGSGRLGIISIFVITGLLLGIVGAVAGALGGIWLTPHVSALCNFFTGTPLYPPHLFGIEAAPRIDLFTVSIRILAAILLSIIATLPVAIWAGYRQPLEALRHE
ncbi:MAG: ABC transporter permease [Planctomycetes bacterium]|nr:ABC transporter permease [Planctomycetota bacterium]